MHLLSLSRLTGQVISFGSRCLVFGLAGKKTCIRFGLAFEAGAPGSAFVVLELVPEIKNIMHYLYIGDNN